MHKKSTPNSIIKNEESVLIVGWDCEYDTINGFTPISTQFYVLNDQKEYFWSHLNKHLAFKDLIEYLHKKYPTYSSIKLVTHFSIAEIQCLADGRDLVLNGNFRSVHKTFIGNCEVEIGGIIIEVELVDTYLLSMTSLEKIGQLIGYNKLSSNGYRDSGDMLSWFKKEPKQFEEYATRDAEIAVRFYVKVTEELGALKLEKASTIGAVYERTLFKNLIGGDYSSLGFEKRQKNLKGRTVGSELILKRELTGFISSYYGGRNETYIYGKYENEEVNDYDLMSAYSSIMSILPNWDFDNPDTVTDPKILYKVLKKDPLSVGFVNINFEFKDNVVYPSLPVKIDSGLFFPKKGITVCTLQEFLISYPYLKKCKILAYVYRTQSSESEIAKFTRLLKKERDKAKQNGEIFRDALLKNVSNSGYGKFLQGLSDRTSIDLQNSTENKIVSKNMPNSKITNVVVGSFITGCVRALIGEYLHYFSKNKIEIASTTTDGFMIFNKKLSDAELKGVSHYSNFINSLVGGNLLELKHKGIGFLGIKTRGYTMLDGENILASITGVSLRGFSVSQKKDFMVQEFNICTRFKDTKYSFQRIVSVREFLNKQPLGNVHASKSYNWDYDFKRRPYDAENDSFNKLRFKTQPFLNAEEITLYRDSYHDFKRGYRESGRQVGIKNKLVTLEHLLDFELYVKLRSIKFNSIKNIGNRTPFRIFVNLVHRFKGWGYKRLSTELKIPQSTVKYWIKESPISEEDLRRGVVCELLRVLNTSQFVPPGLIKEIEIIWNYWVQDVQNHGFAEHKDKDVALHAFYKADSLLEGGDNRRFITPIE